MDKEMKNTPTCDICQPCCPTVKIDKIEEGMTGKEVADLLYNNFDKLNKSKANKCVERKVRHLLRGENGIYNETAKNKFIQQVFYTWSKKDYNSTIDYVLNNAPSIEVGTTTTLPAGSQATVTAIKDGRDAVLNFGIPKGDKGDQGIKGDSGVQLGDIVLSQELGNGEDVTVSQKTISKTLSNEFYKSVLLNQAQYSVLVNQLIKELYIPNVSDLSNYTIGDIRKNFDSDGYKSTGIYLYNTKDNSKVISFSASSLLSNSLEIIESYNTKGAYIVVDWSILKDGDRFISDGKNTEYLLDSQYITQLNYSPIIKEYLNNNIVFLISLLSQRI